jgi:uncharacterized protein (TIGR02246 family)
MLSMSRCKRVVVLILAMTAAVVGLAAEQSGAGRTARMAPEDHTEIQQLYARYAHTLDSGDAEGWARTFTPDGVFGNRKGAEALAEFARNFYKNGSGNIRHWYNQLVVTPTPEGANGTCYFVLIDVTKRAMTTTGIYKDMLVKTSDGWRFKERVATTERPPAAAQPGSNPPAPSR